jgi:type I site-specific restriction endonuclease
MFFDCWDSLRQEGHPTFAYTIREGIREKHLADYKIYAAESVLTFEGTEWEDEEIGFADWGKNAESC